MALQKLGKYEIRSEIGRGAMGLVYRAYDPILEREVAIKTMMATASVMDGESKERFYREARSAAKLTHRNIVTIYDMGEDQDIPFIAMEYLDGIDLHRKMKKEGVIPLREALEITSQVLRGLNYAHAFKIVHRDIKPANVYILRNGTAKVLDFGIAKLADSGMTRTGMVLGTVDYMSPEQIRAERSVDGRSDLFSAGVILYELISGKKPFPGEAITQIMYRIVHESPLELPKSRDLPPNLEQICRKALEKSPDGRYQSGDEFARELESVIASMDAELTTMQLESPDLDSPGRLTAARRLFEGGSFDQSSQILEGLLEEDEGNTDAKELLETIRRRRTSDSTLVLEPEEVPGSTGGRSSIEQVLEEIEEERKTSPPPPGRDETGAADLTVRLADSGITESGSTAAGKEPEKPDILPTEVLDAKEVASISGRTPSPVPPVAEPVEAKEPAPEPEPGPARPAPKPAPAPRPTAERKKPAPAPLPKKGLSPAVLASGAVAILVAAIAVWWLFLRPGPEPGGETSVPAGATEAVAPAGEEGGTTPVAGAPGFLAVDAHPWAEVVAVTEAGTGRQVALPPEPTTPLVLDLPAGTYQIVLRHPRYGDLTVEDLVLTAGAFTNVSRAMPGFRIEESLPPAPR